MSTHPSGRLHRHLSRQRFLRHVAEATRTVHVVDDMETQQDGIPIVMYHYVYSADNPPEDLNANYILDTDLDAQLAYLSENDYYFPSYPELKAFIEGTHSLPAKSIVLTFDDGQNGVFTLGGPLFEKYHIPVTSFIICNNSDAGDVVVTYQNPYISFQSHSFGLHQPGGTVGHGGLISALNKDEIVEDLGARSRFSALPKRSRTPSARCGTDDAARRGRRNRYPCASTIKTAGLTVVTTLRAAARTHERRNLARWVCVTNQLTRTRHPISLVCRTCYAHGLQRGRSRPARFHRDHA